MADLTITIPPEALEAGKDTAFAWLRSHMEDDVRVQHMTDEELTELVSAACLAMLNAWPGMSVEKTHIGVSSDVFSQDIILPLPKEPGNDT
jgi:ferric iron reductase protein FhuF